MGAIDRTPPDRSRSKTAARKSKTGLDYDARYRRPEYKQFCARVHKATNGVCCCCLKNKSEEIHHTSYKGRGDTPGDNAFAVCIACHAGVCHSSLNWIRSRQNPIWESRNTEEFTQRMQLGYQLLRGGIEK